MHSIKIENLRKSYQTKEKDVEVLHGIDFEFQQGKMTAVMGPSGSGKSTLLQCVAGLDKPTSGAVFHKDIDITKLKEKELNIVRREKIGFIFQVYNLLPMLTVYENVILPLQLAKRRFKKKDILEILRKVGLYDYKGRYPSQLSGGQQQRVAIARTLATKPDVLFADEPTGALDTSTSKQILSLLRSTVDEYQQTVIMVTHDPVAACVADQVVFLVDGKIINVLEKPSVEQIGAVINGWESC
ncbi:MAG: ABC transporter ATP-binding protein [Firmicutes bacterium]|nr:ABC transporter ATP-binding protein [Bacillota bacterium]